MATQGKKSLLGTYGFRGWVHDHHGGEHGCRQTCIGGVAESLHFDTTTMRQKGSNEGREGARGGERESESTNWEWHRLLRPQSLPLGTHTPPPTRPQHLLILPK